MRDHTEVRRESWSGAARSAIRGSSAMAGPCSAGQAVPPAPGRRGALRGRARARAAGAPAPGRHPPDGARVPQASRLVHPGPARGERPAAAPVRRSSRSRRRRRIFLELSRAGRRRWRESRAARGPARRRRRRAPRARPRRSTGCATSPSKTFRSPASTTIARSGRGSPRWSSARGRPRSRCVAICERLEAATRLVPRHPGARADGRGPAGALSADGLECAGPHRASRRRRKRPRVRARRRFSSYPPARATCPVAEEAAVVAEAFGHPVERLDRRGRRRIHRLLAAGEQLRRARVVIVVAGMEGALPSVVGGLVAVPVIAVPTSVGYGASFGGLAALLAMLNSCAAGRDRGEHRQRVRRRRRGQPDLPRMTRPHRSAGGPTAASTGSTWCIRPLRSWRSPRARAARDVGGRTGWIRSTCPSSSSSTPTPSSSSARLTTVRGDLLDRPGAHPEGRDLLRARRS